MVMQTTRPKKGILPAVGLVFLAPLVAEFLLGNLPIKLLPALIVLAPMYGGGALFIREIVRRTGRGWPTIILLALAYGILEEAFTTQSLFNPNYLKLNLHLLDHGYIPALGIGAWWTVFVLALHTVWSISVSIALVEAAVPDRATTPWLGRIGFAVTALLFAIGIVGTTLIGLHQDRYITSAAHFAWAGVAMILLVVAASLLPPPRQATDSGFAPNPWIIGALGLVAGSAILITPPKWGWGAAGAILALELGVAAPVLHWAKGTRWTMRHKLALAGGAAMAYAWHAFVQTPVLGGTVLAVRIGNALFALGAIALIAFAARRTATTTQSKIHAVQ